jgi:hypothetical protein
MEKLCGELGHNLLLSSRFALRCGRETTSLGHFALRGVAEELEIAIPRPP